MTNKIYIFHRYLDQKLFTIIDIQFWPLHAQLNRDTVSIFSSNPAVHGFVLE